MATITYVLWQSDIPGLQLVVVACPPTASGHSAEQPFQEEDCLAGSTGQKESEGEVL